MASSVSVLKLAGIVPSPLARSEFAALSGAAVTTDDRSAHGIYAVSNQR